ncbi:MAG: hypothetical protein V4564_13865 [Pseudomonadota bacterium]|uniref:hypothetical protein n=1 Tax=Sphingomonas sp. ERG5 TaxID=1381597 RepID=UPI00068CB934|nr:hypothetical protein [Sphingomonas sp. ERG5]
MVEQVALRSYDTSLDRAGLALATGGLMGGLFAVLLVLFGGSWSLLPLVVAFIVGSIISAMAIIAIGGPLWLICHALGKRGPVAAATVGAVAGFALFLGGQTYGFGLFDMPVSDARTLLFRILSGIATSLVLAGFSAAIGLAMWRVAYRRVV